MVFVSGLSWEKFPRLMLQRISWVPYKMGITTITLKIKDNFLFLNVWKFCREKKVKTAVVRHLLGWLYNRSCCAEVSQSEGQDLMAFLPCRCSQVHKLLPQQKTGWKIEVTASIIKEDLRVIFSKVLWDPLQETAFVQQGSYHTTLGFECWSEKIQSRLLVCCFQ
jgi:hypothetical protein